MTWTGKYKPGAIAGAWDGKYTLGTRAGKLIIFGQVDQHTLGVRANKYKFGASAGKYKLGARAGKYKFGARVGGQAKGWGPGNTNTRLTEVTLVEIGSLNQRNTLHSYILQMMKK